MILNLSRSQQMALTSILVTYMQLADEPQEFHDCSTNDTPVTTTPDLLHLLMNVAISEAATEVYRGDSRSAEEWGKMS